MIRRALTTAAKSDFALYLAMATLLFGSAGLIDYWLFLKPFLER